MVGRDPTTAASPTRRPTRCLLLHSEGLLDQRLRLELGRGEDFPPHASAEQITPDPNLRR